MGRNSRPEVVAMSAQTPNPAMHRTLRKKPRKAGDFERWAS